MTATPTPISRMSAWTSNLGPLAQQQATKMMPSAIAIGIFLLIWQLLCMGEDANLPPPLTVLTDTWDLIINPFFDNGGNDKGLFWQILASLQRVAVGFTLSTAVGVGVGILIGSNAKVYAALDPIFQLLRTVPPLAWLPISLAALQESETSAIFVIFITAIWPILINTAVGVQQVPQDYRNVSKVLQLSRIQYFFNVLLPAAAPYMFTGLRIGIGLAWLAIVAAEMLLGGVGIGFFIWDAWNSSQISELILALIYIGLVGLLLDRLIEAISKLVVSEDV